MAASVSPTNSHCPRWRAVAGSYGSFRRTRPASGACQPSTPQTHRASQYPALTSFHGIETVGSGGLDLACIAVAERLVRPLLPAAKRIEGHRAHRKTSLRNWSGATRKGKVMSEIPHPITWAIREYLEHLESEHAS